MTSHRPYFTRRSCRVVQQLGGDGLGAHRSLRDWITYPGPEKASTPALFTVALSGKMNGQASISRGARMSS